MRTPTSWGRGRFWEPDSNEHQLVRKTREGCDSPYFLTNRSRTGRPTRRLNRIGFIKGRNEGGGRTHSELTRGSARPHRFCRYGQRRRIRTFVSIATTNVRRE